VLAVYHALAASPQWEKTLLVIFYDEHGGFFDHLAPPGAPDDQQMFGRYGVRVPALVVSPWVEPRSVSHTVLDHTSVIKTILLRFCPGALDEPERHHGLLARVSSAGRPPSHGDAGGARP